MTLLEAAADLRSRRIFSTELATAALARIARLNPKLNAFITVTEEAALRAARQADAELASGRDRGPLHGIPIAVKDLFYTRGVRTTSGSKLFENFAPDHDATVVERLAAAGAVPLGKLNMHELAYGVTSDNPHYGPVRNPWDATRSPGGSSGGSGAAVAANLVYAAMGTDTGGSIRIPAAFCGTVGLKPTYGRVSRYGVQPLAWSLDHMGPLTRSVRDAALVLNAIAGYDPRDPAASRRPVVDTVPDEGCSIRGLRIGFAASFFENVSEDIGVSVRGAIAHAASLGAEVKPVALPDLAALNAAGSVILMAEASALMEPYRARRADFGAGVLALLDQGRLIPATDYVNAQRLRRALRREFGKVWREVDCLMLPTTPHAAPRIGGDDVRLATTHLARAFNVLGLPALSMPCGLSADGLPVGLQIVGAAFEEALILRVGAALEDDGVGIPPCPV